MAENREEVRTKEQSCKDFSTPNRTTSSKEATKSNNHKVVKLHREKMR
jgi:hypothetical protein